MGSINAMVHSKIDLLLMFFHVGGDANMSAVNSNK
jgi:hypothetical protein